MNVIVSETALTLLEGQVLCGLVLKDRDGKEYPLSIGQPSASVLRGLFTIFNVFTWEQLKGTYCVITLNENNQIVSVQDILGVHPPVTLSPVEDDVGKQDDPEGLTLTN